MDSARFCADFLTKKATAAGDITLHAIALRTGVRESTISRLVSGRTAPSLATLVAVADAYGCSLDDLVIGRTKPPLRRVPGQHAGRKPKAVPA
ncbi:Helix-turn-helix protein [Streptomyces sp. ADI96-15]|uniref:helix-turn-helix domain-containing protein n=1 Tax=Streptomyces TaxID=1883 RepID=UPI000FAA5A78|nr:MULTISPECIES: helix-turn-helix transcriptional regulator [Streptomyces]MDH6189212.1 transcriptional regulator with XRE-family HTH domain [Streptomyces sp. CZ24]RPK57934.1 Helix-turn-helix protein [Streptomyces sp. ADI96-15]